VSDEDDAKRAANEATFRAANEHIRAARDDLQPPIDRVPFICECDDVACRSLILLTRAEYEFARRESTTFLVLRGHSSQGEVVSEHESYAVMRKTGVEADVAAALDPRDEAT
jgi:hypothetical protein